MRRREKESDFAILANNMVSSSALGSLGFCVIWWSVWRGYEHGGHQRDHRHTVMRRRIDSRKASSSARNWRTSASVLILMRMVRAFLAMA